MSTSKKYIVLEVDAGRCDELVAALLQRSYIKLADVNTLTSRKTLSACPACDRSFVRMSNKTVDESLLWDLLGLLRMMRNYSTVALYDQSIDEVLPINRGRAVKFGDKNRKIANSLKLIDSIVEGGGPAYYANERCLDFLSGKAKLAPAIISMSDGKILDITGEVHIDDISAKSGAISGLVHDIKDTIKKLPVNTTSFVKTGQISLI